MEADSDYLNDDLEDEIRELNITISELEDELFELRKYIPNDSLQDYMKLNKKCRLEKYKKNCSSNSNKKTYKQSYLENITKYLELIDIDIRNLPNQFNYFNEMKLNILDN
jgi:hypothetical protein